MNPNEEKNFKEYLKDNTPDLWAKIDSQLPSGMYTKNSLDTTTKDDISNKSTENKDTPEEEQDSPSSDKIVKFKPRKIYKISAILAACLVLVSLGIYSYHLNGHGIKQESNMFAKDNISSVADTDDTNSSSDKKSWNNNSNYDYNFENNAVTNESANDSTLESDMDNIDSSKDNSPLSTVAPTATTDRIINIQISVKKLHTTDIGLVYEGIILHTNSGSLQPKQTVYVSLRNLTKHDLRHTYEPNETFKVTIATDSYVSSVNNPLFATEMIQGYNKNE